ncbi:hypothetical protein C5C31_11645 [Rathayibacter rathayi]|uniref:DUF8175 domain-containing protein n=1 Tax=Rathayibacter rathayi TaxID=33887 RepID=A0ABX5AFX3_RATRA|nr:MULTISPECIES: hypothetical protein [Rathayibacter]PPF28041.1 hypothetical protein C5C06_08565 [Rathayibacter tritici]PPF66176.1 hypothetical protein C5C21_09820 [Rathayibacter tritici]PPG05960.1 hypothetical protein C5C18_11780 [Rathayibacter tritici]PPG66513.1 hypothetical protein C5C02_11185 [Rathayibacter rathayi]PPG74881.1 hypothetical protein C5C23_11760 [Rathayibacter rathayi]
MTDTSSNMGGGNTKGKGRITTIAATIGVVVIAACAVIVAPSLLNPTPAAPAGTASAAPTASATAIADADRSICGLPGFEESGTLHEAPTPASWSTVGLTGAPALDTAGPGVISAIGLRSCYAHTTQGAVVAAINMWAMATSSELLLPMAQQLMTGEGQAEMVAHYEATPPAANGRLQILGFQVLSYSAEQAAIDVAANLTLADGSTRMMSLPMALRWTDGDWKQVIAKGPQSVYPPVALQSMGGYVPWAQGDN